MIAQPWPLRLAQEARLVLRVAGAVTAVLLTLTTCSIPSNSVSTPTPRPPGPSTPTQSSPTPANARAHENRPDIITTPQYWSRFPLATQSDWASPDFFPIGVFYGKPSHAANLREIGINTFVGAEHDGSSIASITSTGMYVIAQLEWTPYEIGDNNRVIGWHISDECDMGYSGCDLAGAAKTEYDHLRVQQRYARTARSYHDGRFLHSNFGNGVLRTYWAPNTMRQLMDTVDVTSVDKYAYTSPSARELILDSPDFPSGADPGRAATYGWLNRQMALIAGPEGDSKPNWVMIETAMPYLTDPGARSITPEQISGAVWSAITNGATGIVYFQHNNSDECGNYSLVDCSVALRDAVRQINRRIRRMAPILTAPSADFRVDSRADVLVKAPDGNDLYIIATLAVGEDPGPVSFRCPPCGDYRNVEVVDEQRTIPIRNGEFGDTFDTESSVRIYRLIG